MTGMDNHLAGLGNMAETTADNQLGKAGYEGYLRPELPTVAEILRSEGYHTYMAGKWHLGLQREQSPFARGFERSLASLYGAGSHFADRAGPDIYRDTLLYRRDGELLEQLPENFYSTRAYTDRIIDNISSNHGDGRPFFAYLAYTAPHWPLHLPDDYIDRYRGSYAGGYEKVRTERLQRLQQSGRLPTDFQPGPFPPGVERWADLSPTRQAFLAQGMELYAGMVDYMDMSIGRLIDYLRSIGEYDNTVILFISDNGAEPWGHDNVPPIIRKTAESFDNSAQNRGRSGSFSFHGREWAAVGSGPLRHYKGSAAEGGIRVPAIMAGSVVAQRGQWVNEIASVVDFLPTVLELAGSDYEATSFSGRSLLPLVSADQPDDEWRRTLGVELWGHSALLQADWKILRMEPPLGSGVWELYRLGTDIGEQTNLANVHPSRMQSMLEEWQRYKEENNVILSRGPLQFREPGPPPQH